MTQYYLCLHSIRTQPSTPESCITYPSCSLLPSRRLIVFYLLLFSTFFFCHLTVFSTQSRVPPPSLSLYSILYPLLWRQPPRYLPIVRWFMNYSLIVFIFFSPMIHSLRPSPDHQRPLASTQHLNFLYIFYDLSHVYSECILATFFFIPIELNGLPICERAKGIRALSGVPSCALISGEGVVAIALVYRIAGRKDRRLRLANKFGS